MTKHRQHSSKGESLTLTLVVSTPYWHKNHIFHDISSGNNKGINYSKEKFMLSLNDTVFVTWSLTSNHPDVLYATTNPLLGSAYPYIIAAPAFRLNIYLAWFLIFNFFSFSFQRHHCIKGNALTWVGMQ